MPRSRSGSRAWPPRWPAPPPATSRCSRCWPTALSCFPARPTALRELRIKAGLAVEPEAPSRHPQIPRRLASSVRSSRSPRSRATSPTRSSRPTSRRRQTPRPRPRLLADWELIRPLLRAFEESTADAPSCMTLPEPSHAHIAAGLDLMPHQAQVVAKAKDGHRTFLLADEPGLGKTAQALLAAQAAHAYPLLVVVPNVVKTSWAREAAHVDPEARRHRHPRRRRDRRRVLRHRRRQLRHPRPARRMARHLRLPRDGHRRGPLHQEQVVAALAERARPVAARSASARHGRCSWRSPVRR